MYEPVRTSLCARVPDGPTGYELEKEEQQQQEEKAGESRSSSE